MHTNEWKYKHQFERLGLRSEELERNLRKQEVAIKTMSRSDAANARASHRRLVRDFHYAQSTFKTLKLEVKQRQKHQQHYQQHQKSIIAYDNHVAQPCEQEDLNKLCDDFELELEQIEKEHEVRYII